MPRLRRFSGERIQYPGCELSNLWVIKFGQGNHADEQGVFGPDAAACFDVAIVVGWGAQLILRHAHARQRIGDRLVCAEETLRMFERDDIGLEGRNITGHDREFDRVFGRCTGQHVTASHSSATSYLILAYVIARGAADRHHFLPGHRAPPRSFTCFATLSRIGCSTTIIFANRAATRSR